MGLFYALTTGRTRGVRWSCSCMCSISQVWGCGDVRAHRATAQPRLGAVMMDACPSLGSWERPSWLSSRGLCTGPEPVMLVHSTPLQALLLSH